VASTPDNSPLYFLRTPGSPFLYKGMVGLASKLIMHKDVNRDNKQYGKLVDVKRVADNLGYCNSYGNRTVTSVLAD
jgi:hypothetical protein